MKKRVIFSLFMLSCLLLFNGCSAENKISENAEIVLPLEYETIQFLGDDYYIVKKNDEKYGIIDKNGEVIVEPKYDLIYENQIGGKAYYPVKINDEDKGTLYGILDSNGEELYLLDYEPYWPNFILSEGNLYPDKNNPEDWKDEKWGYRSKDTGEWVIEPRWSGMAHPFHDGIAIVEDNREVMIGGMDFTDRVYGYIYEDGSYLLKPEYPYLSSFNSGIGTLPVTNEVKVKIEGGTPLFSWLTGIDTSNLTTTNTSYIFVNKDGYAISEKYWNGTKGYDNGFAYVKSCNKWSIIDMDGNIIQDSIFDSVMRLENGLYAVEKYKGVWGIANNKGEIIIKPSKIFGYEGKLMDEVQFLNDDVFILKQDDKSYVINNREIEEHSCLEDFVAYDCNVVGYIDGVTIIYEDDKLKFVDGNTNDITEIPCDKYSDSRNGEVIIYVNDKCGVIKQLSSSN